MSPFTSGEPRLLGPAHGTAKQQLFFFGGGAIQIYVIIELADKAVELSLWYI